MASYENLDYGSSDGSLWGVDASQLLAFWGGTPASQRAYSSAVHATSAQATSSAFGATQLATLQEIQDTFIALGIWATA